MGVCEGGEEGGRGEEGVELRGRFCEEGGREVGR